MNDENKTYLIRDAEAEELTLQEQRPSASKVLYEDTEKRDRYSKHFRLENGNFMAVMYDHPVHEPDPKTGKYMEIVRELKENETDYEAKTDRFKARFPKEEGGFITVEKEEKAVSWRFVSKQKSRGKKSMATFRKKEKKEAWDLEEVPSVRYEKADGDTDFQYDISEDGVKESIVLMKCPQAKEFVFEMKLQELKAELSEDKKEVFLCSEDGSEEMRIPPAFMVDEKGAYSDDIHYELEEKKGTLFLKLVLDTDWIEAPERQFPVVIDPRVDVVTYGTKPIRMVEVRSNGGQIAVESETNSRRIGVDSNGIIHRLYVEMDLLNLPEGSKITKAALIFHQKGCEYSGDVDRYEAYTVNAAGYSLASTSFVWNNVKNLPVTGEVGGFYGSIKAYYEDIEIDLTNPMSRWYNNPNESRCLMIKKRYEDIGEYDDCTCTCTYNENYVDLYSTYSSTYQPSMYIEYTNIDMYADHQQHYTFENGRAGSGNVNLFHGNFMFAHNDMVLNNPKLPVSISHFYRPDFTGTTYGLGWKLSTAQKLEVLQGHDIYAVYTDSQGKRHYFNTDSDDNITDDGGLGLTLTHGCDSGTQCLYRISDKQGNEMQFDESGRLTKMMNANGNANYLSYIGGNLSAVLDSEGHMFRFLYENGKLHQMINPNGDILCFTYTGDLLTGIEYPSPEGDIRKTTFAYSNGRMSKITDCSGVSYTITYDAYGRVSKIGNSGSVRVTDDSAQSVSSVTGEEILFEYRGASTAVQDARTKVKNVYKFDQNGRVLFTYQDLSQVTDSSLKSETTLTSLHQYETVVKGNGKNGTIKYTSLSASLNNDAADEENLLQNGCFTDATDPLNPSGWLVDGAVAGAAGVSTEHYLSGKKSYCFGANNQRIEKNLSQTVSRDCLERKGNVLIASAWAKASEQVVAGTDKNGARFRLSLSVMCSNGATEDVSVDFDTEYYGWQYVAVPLVLEDGFTPISIKVTMDFRLNKGSCYFTNARLVWGEGEITRNTYYQASEQDTQFGWETLPGKYVFGEFQEIVQDTKIKRSDYTITSYQNKNWDEVYRVIRDKDGHEFESYMKYDDHHNLIKAKDYRGIVMEMTYNPRGKMETKKIYHQDKEENYFYEQYGYNQQDFLISELDQRYSLDGSPLERHYSYDVSRCLMTGETDLNGQTYQHTYDEATQEQKTLSSSANGITQENIFSYRKGYLTELSHHGVSYGFTFDALGRSETVRVGGGELFLTQYGKTNTSDTIYRYYASGEETLITNDIFGNPVLCAYKGNGDEGHRTLYTASYDHAGKLKKEVDNESHICHNYTYNQDGQPVQIQVTDANGNVLRTSTFTYDDQKRLETTTYGATGHTYLPIYETTDFGIEYPDEQTVGITLDGKYTDQIEKDSLGRVSKRTLTLGYDRLLTQNYRYLQTAVETESETTPFPFLTKGTTIETGMISGITGKLGDNQTEEVYTYDINGNIETVTIDSELMAKYTYDSWNRLVREDNYVFGKSYTYKYDQGGNIIQRTGCCFCEEEPSNKVCCVDTFQYATSGWKDQLISYNGKTCEYDVLGNLTQYGETELEWTRVRKLARFGDVTFTYDAKGMRTGKTKNGVTHSYIYEGDLLLKETIGNNTITYYHGNDGIIGFNYLDTDFFYRKNLQGDVIAICTADGTVFAKYVYDAWGNHKVYDRNNIPVTIHSHIGYINPIRYRGYYYDVETKLYYCQTRYYSPELCRWLSADTIEYLEPGSINGLNLYCYCLNNPVMYADQSGHWIETVFDLFSLGASVVEVVINPYDPLNWAGLIGDAVDLLPLVTGVGEGIRATKMVKYADDVIDSSYDTIKFVKASDMVEHFSDTGKMLDDFEHIDDYYKFTVSNLKDGRKIHKLFMDNGMTITGSRLRVDGLNKTTKTVFELKPYNIRNARKGVKQILNYNDALGGGYKMVIVLY